MYQSFALQRLLTMRLGVLLCVLATSLAGCRKDDDTVQLLDDPSLNNGQNFPNNWYYLQNNSNHKFFWSPKADNPKDFYFAIETGTLDAVNYSVFIQTVKTPIPKGKQLVLRAKVKAEQLTGLGADLAIRCEGPQGLITGALSQPENPIKGDFDWKEFTVVLDKVPDETTSIVVALLYERSTTGKVYFDDITLSYQK